ncbi:MAG TPA: type I glyceraldehyde-3-phosphate dehydrogenase [Pseudonocardiaceae bacterium]|nr:type I glyceraldehyde-3-phosphate dehydrogenase [Pseudonocardiaceae bacterium]
MAVRVGINGFGRIGRDFLRAVVDRGDTGIEVVAANDVMDPATAAHLLRYDSTYGPWRRQITTDPHGMHIDGMTIRMNHDYDPSLLAWDDVGVDVVVESTGRFRTRDAAAAHLRAGARKVVLSAPGKGVDGTFVMGVNDGDYDPKRHHVISNASCTTNCVAPMLLVLHREFTVRRGLLTTIHSYTNDQNVLDGPHKDMRRARSAAVNMIPTTTGAAKAVGEVLPALAGKLDGVAVRVPIDDGSLSDLTVELDEQVTVAEINAAFADASIGDLKGILRYSDEPLVSRDIVGDESSCVFDAGLTRIADGLVKVFGWYDNEWGYTARLVDLVRLVGA